MHCHYLLLRRHRKMHLGGWCCQISWGPCGEWRKRNPQFEKHARVQGMVEAKQNNFNGFGSIGEAGICYIKLYTTLNYDINYIYQEFHWNSDNICGVLPFCPMSNTYTLKDKYKCCVKLSKTLYQSVDPTIGRTTIIINIKPQHGLWPWIALEYDEL